MNQVFIIIILFSLLLSTPTGIWILKKKGNKWLGLLVAFIINTLVLSSAALILYKFDIPSFHKQTSGVFGSLGILVLVFFIPIITCINYYISEFVRNRVRVRSGGLEMKVASATLSKIRAKNG